MFFIGVHHHRYGTSVTLFESDDMSMERFIEYLGDTYEPDREESLELEQVEPVRL